jgi:hypothetical protein
VKSIFAKLYGCFQPTGLGREIIEALAKLETSKGEKTTLDVWVDQTGGLVETASHQLKIRVEVESQSTFGSRAISDEISLVLKRHYPRSHIDVQVNQPFGDGSMRCELYNFSPAKWVAS